MELCVYAQANTLQALNLPHVYDQFYQQSQTKIVQNLQDQHHQHQTQVFLVDSVTVRLHNMRRLLVVVLTGQRVYIH